LTCRPVALRFESAMDTSWMQHPMYVATMTAAKNQGWHAEVNDRSPASEGSSNTVEQKRLAEVMRSTSYQEMRADFQDSDLSPRRPSEGDKKRKAPKMEQSDEESPSQATPLSGGEPFSRETSTYEPTTPEVLRKLSKVVAEGGDLPSPSTVASRLAAWAAQAQAKAPLAAELSKQDHSQYKFGKEKAAEAAQAIATLREALNRTKNPARGQGKTHVEIIFKDPVPTAKALAARIHHFYGKDGPKVKVQLLEEANGCTWSKQRDTVNYATTKGDERLFVLSLNVPPMVDDPSSVKAAKVSIQLRARTGEVKVLGEKGVLLKLTPNLTMAFGCVERVSLSKTQGAPDLSAFWA